MKSKRNRRRTKPRVSRLEQLENRLLLASDWQNPARPSDVNNDMVVSPLDALLVINELNRGGSRALGARPHQLARYLDTNGDASVSPIDALRVINQLNRGDDLTLVRSEGESEPAPAGFISVVFATLPGSSSEIIELSSQINIVREEFNEIGLFVMDGPEGEVNGVFPTSARYADEVFGQADRRVLYSRQGMTSHSNSVVMPAGSWVGVYVLQETSDNGNPEDHLRVMQQGTFRHRIGWEEHVTSSPWGGVGDRGYDDVLVDIQLGTPFDPDVEPAIAPIADQSIDELQQFVYRVEVTDENLPDDVITFSLDGEPDGMSIDPVSGQISWTPKTLQGPATYEVVVRATDSSGLFDLERFDISVVAVLSEGQLFANQRVATFTVPDNTDSLTFTLASLDFDTSDPDFINDAFEVALVDDFGNSLVPTFRTGRDAFFNESEDAGRTYGSGVSDSTSNITLGITGVLPGENANLVFRLVNDDEDASTKARISAFSLPATWTTDWAPRENAAAEPVNRNSTFNEAPLQQLAQGFTAGALDPSLPNVAVPVETNAISLFPSSGKLNFTAISTPFNAPIGIDYHSPTDSIVITTNYSSGQPRNFERIELDGTHVAFSDAAGFTDEVKIGTVRPNNAAGFLAGDLFVGNGVDGQIVRITDNGDTVVNPWVDLPGNGNGLLRGSLFVDRGETFGGDLLVVTTGGEAWRIDSSGTPTLLADVNTHLEGLAIVPNDPERYGPIAGTAIAGAENQGLLYAFSPDGTVQNFNVGVAIEDIDIVPANENFFGVNFGTGRILGAPASQFLPYVGDILLTTEFPSGSGLYRLEWDGAQLVSRQLELSPDSASVGQWEHVTFAPAGIVEVSPVGRPPVISASTPRRVVDTGQTAVISGNAQAFGQVSMDVPNTISHITINGRPVDVIDSANQFFAIIDVSLGENVFTLTAWDAAGQSSSVRLSITGDDDGESLDVSRFSDITGAFSGVYGRTSFNEEDRFLHVDLATRNDGTFESDVPLLVSVRNISDSNVRVVNADGYLPDGTPYIDFSDAIADGKLNPGEISGAPTVTFFNPLRTQFSYDLVFLGKLNEAPVINTIPNLEAYYGRDYIYDVDATDADGDTLTYELLTYPADMQIDGSSGQIDWSPEIDDAGSHPIEILVSDGRGGMATQRFTLVVAEAPPNRPPIFTSTPVTTAYLGENPGVAFSNEENDKFFILGGSVGQTVTARFDWTIRQASFNNEFGVYAIDDVTGSVDGVLPGESGYGQAALAESNSRVVFRSGLGAGAIADVELVAGQLYAAYIIQNGTAEQYRTGTRTAFFSYEQAHGGTDRLRAEILPNGRTQFAWEDSVDFDFTDVVYTITTDELQLGIEQPYYYDADAIDPDRDQLTYSLLTAPDGVSIDENTGEIFWNPAVDQVGNHRFEIESVDGNGGVATQEFIVCVHPDPLNNPPTIITDPITSYDFLGFRNPHQGDVDPKRISLTLPPGGSFTQRVSLDVPALASGQADIVFVVDESGSMDTEHGWLGEMITSLDVALESKGISDAKYGLVGFTNTARSFDIGGELLGSAADFATASQGLRLDRGGTEDGYVGVNHVLATYPFREGAAVNIVLVTDEDRDRANGGLNFEAILAAVEDVGGLLNVTVDGLLLDANDSSAVGVDSLGNAYLPDGNGGFTLSTGGRFDRIGEGIDGARTTFDDYIRLAWDSSGATWDLNQLRSGGALAESFTKAFVDIKAQEIQSQLSLDVIASDPSIDIQNLTGVVNAGSGGTTATFDVQFTAPGDPVSFDLLFVRAGTTDTVASVPVVINYDYAYLADAVDPDSDDLTWELLNGPIGLSVDPQSGRVDWDAFQTGAALKQTSFSEDSDGWLLANGNEPNFRSVGGSPGGALRVTGGTIVAPELFRGDLRFFDRGSISFDAKYYDRGNGSGVASFGSVTFFGGAQSATVDIAASSPGTNWSNFAGEMTASAAGVTQEQWLEILSNVTDVRVDLNAFGGNDVIGFDNFTLEGRLSGEFPVSLQVSDGRGGVDVQNFTIVVDDREGTGILRGTKSTSDSVDIDNWVIYLDQNQNGVRDVGERFTLTGADGSYEFSGLPEDTYFVREELQQGWTQTAPAEGQDFLGDAYADVLLDSFDPGNTPFPWPYGQNLGSTAFNVPVNFDVILGPPPSDFQDGGTLGAEFLSLPVGSSITVGFTDENIIDGPGDDIFVQSLDDAAGEHADVYVGSSIDDLVFLAQIGEGGSASLDLASIGYQGNVNVVRIVGVDNLGAAPGFDLVSIKAVNRSQVLNDGYVVHLSDGEVVEDLDFANRRVDTNGNLNPFFESTPITTATSHDIYRYDATARDPEHDTLTFSLPLAPSGMTVHPTRGTIVWIPNEQQTGRNNVLLRVEDGRGGAALQPFSIDVGLPNSLPVITSSASVNAVADTQYRYPLQAQDAEDSLLSFSIVEGPTGATIQMEELHDEQTGALIARQSILIWDVPATAAGSVIPLSVSVEDSNGGVGTQTWSVEVKDIASANSDPEITSTPRRSARVGLPWNYILEASDSDGDPLSYSLTSAPVGMSISDSGLLTWTPNNLGTEQIELSVSDGRGGSAIQAFELTVNSVEQNAVPRITSIPRTSAIISAPYEYDVNAFDSDGDRLTYALTSSPRGMSIDSNTGQIRWQPDDQQLGSHFVTVQVTDALMGRNTQRFEISVGCSNLAPAIVSIPPTVGLSERVYLYAVRAEDFEQDELTWSLSEAPEGMAINPDTGVILWTPAITQIGSHDVVVTVTDGFMSGTQSYTVVVSDSLDLIDLNDPTKGTKGNRPPIFTSNPNFAAEVDALYQYQVTAVDPDGDTVTLSLGSGTPQGMQISSDGRITWTPQAADTGEHLVNVVAVDEHGATASQGFLLSVALNSPPQINSSPIETATSGSLYRYTVQAIDPDGDPLTYTLDSAPDGMTVDGRGRILWQSAPSDISPQAVSVTVSDDRGQSVSQSWTITMQADTQAPNVSLLVIAGNESFSGDARVNIGTDYVVRVRATDNVGLENVTLSVDGSLVALDATGAITLNATDLGSVNLQATAVDTSGLESTAVGTVTIIDPANPNQPVPTDPTLPPHPGFDPTDDTGPQVTITSPTIGSEVSNQVPIIGTVDDPEDNLWYYRVFVGRADKVSLTNIDLSDPDWDIIKESTDEVQDAEIAVWDASNVTNDSYVIAVAAFDVNGRGWVEPTVVSIVGNVLVGNFRLDFTDLSIPLSGIPIEVTRVYDTLDADRESDFGFGWSLGMQDARIFEMAAIGQGGALNGGNDKFVPDKTKVYLTDPSGQRVGFTYRERYQGGCSPFIGCAFGAIYTPYFDADPGVYSTLTIDETQVGRGGILGVFGNGINPDNYTLTTKEGLKYRYNQFTGLESITDLNDNVVTFTEDGINHSNGQSIQFVRDHRDRITEIVDPAGNSLLYSYDLAGDLVGFENQIGLPTEYTYLDDPAHFLDEAYDSLDRRVLKAVYEENSETRIVEFKGVIDVNGNRIDQRDFDTDTNTGIIRDANGNATSIIYDDRGNVLTETDPLGNMTRYEYGDPNNPDLETKIVDRRGMVTERAYDTRGNVETIVERGSETNPLTEPVITSFTYDAGNRVTSITNAANTTTAFDYDGDGNLIQITNALGDTSSFTYDNQGRRASFTDFNGNTTTFDYTDACPCGSPSKSTFADGTYQTFGYNQFGQVTLEQYFEADGTLVESRETKYDNAGRIIEEISGLAGDPDHPPTIVRRFYDGHLLDWEAIVHPDSLDANNVLVESPATPVSQRKSRITDFEYDDSDRLIRQVDAQGGVVEFRYDPQGNRVALMDPVGNITTWFYDDLNRVAEERDPFYWENVRATDAAFEQLSDVDFLNLIAPEVAGSLADPLYDDPSGANIAANQGAEHVRVVGYDGEGNQSKTIDRNGRRREFVYDFAGRLLEEQWYNESDHPTAPNALVETISFSYDTLGNMLTATDSNSDYLFTYDTLNRLESVDNNPNGFAEVPRLTLNYEYDAQGNVIKTYDDAGVTVESNYNRRNQLEWRKWFDADGSGDVDDARVDFTYNAAGREATIRRYSDLTATTLVSSTDRTYDLVGRSDLLNHHNATGGLLSGYNYGYDFSGLLTSELRDHQDNQYDQTISYAYDLTGQLTDALFSGQDNEHYVYDLNGNRITSEVGSDQRNYTTGPANQLESDGQYRYEYDGEGNQVKRVDLATGETRTFVYDHRNRLVRLDDWSSDPGTSFSPLDEVERTHSTLIEYDALDILRLRSQDADGDGPESSEKVYTVWNSEHAWADFDQAGGNVTRYLFGDKIDQVLARRSNSQTKWFTHDKLGTVRGVLTTSQEVSGEISYDTYGNLADPAILNPTGRFLFTGRELGVSPGLYYYRARFYDAIGGRFIGRDPIGFDAGDPNLYRYVFNSPTNFIDPSGEAVFSELGVLLRSVVARAAIIRCLGFSAFTLFGEAGIYILLTSVGAGPAGASNVYVGQTVDFAVRFYQHDASGVGGRGVRVISQIKIKLSRSVLENPQAFRTAEQLVMNAFGGKAKLLNIRNASRVLFCR